MHEAGDGGRLSDVALAIGGACEGRLNLRLTWYL